MTTEQYIEKLNIEKEIYEFKKSHALTTEEELDYLKDYQKEKKRIYENWCSGN